MAARLERGVAQHGHKKDPGVGLSNHKNSYQRGRVLDGNWVEEQAKLEVPPPPRDFLGETTSRAAFSQDNIKEAGIQHKRYDLLRKHISGHDLLSHQVVAHGTVAPSCFATLYQLTHDPAKTVKVQQNLWQGFKKNDSSVPLSTVKKDLLTTKRGEWVPEEKMFETTTGRSFAALAEHIPEKRTACRPAAEGGQPAQIGRKAKGEFVDELGKTYQRIGLRKP